MNKPTPELIEKVLARLGRPGASTYFFDRLNNPLWIEPLYEKDFFKRPPAAEHFPADGTVAYPDWPELRYLQRMADQAPDIVGKIVLAIPSTDNARVHQTLALLGTKLSKLWAHRLGENIETWLSQPNLRTHFGEAFAQFIAHLARLGDAKLALAIARKLFIVEAEAKVEGAGRALDSWHFERYLKQCLPDLVKADASSTVAFLIGRLRSDIDRESRTSLEDYSYIWRRDILQANFSVKENRDILIDAIRELALQLARDPSFGAEKICRRLVAQKLPILKRIALYVASRAANESDSIVLELLSDLNLVDRQTCRAEYGMLLEAMFPRLPSPQQDDVVRLLTTSDPLQAIPEEARAGLDSEKKARYSSHMARDRLLAFGNALPESLKQTLAKLLEKAGAPPPELQEITAFGAASPLSPDLIQSMSVDEILTFIDTWSPGESFEEPNRDSLARQLHGVAKARVQEFSAQAEKWIDRDPTYVRWVFMGISDAIASNAQIADWTPLLNLMTWVVKQSDPPGTADADQWKGRDVGWAWTRQSIARLIERALTDKNSGFLGGSRKAVWHVLEALLQDADPAPKDAFGAEDVDEEDAMSVAVNSTRGIATESLIRYLWRIHPNDQSAGPMTFGPTPEVRAALERALVDVSPAIRSVFGQWLPTLFHFDFKWTAAHIDKIFPEGENLRGHWRAGWRAFLDYGQPHDPAFAVLRGKYEFAITMLDEESEETNKRMGERGLGNHLASYFWRGLGDGQSVDLLLKFFDRCSAAAAGHTAAFIGNGLQNEAAIPAQTIDRLVSLWETLTKRQARWSERKRREVLRQFSAWFNSIHLNEEWSLNALESVLAAGSGLADSEGVIARLSALATKHPAAVARCTRLLLQDDKQSLLPSFWQREISVLLKTLTEAGDAAAREEAEGIINRLIENGSLFARDIRGQSSSLLG